MAPVTSATGILLTVDKADMPFPFTYPLKELFPVPPLTTSTIPVTFAAFPEMLPLTFPPDTLKILSLVMAPLAMSILAIVPSKILVLVMAPVLMLGEAAVPLRSPVNLIFPATELVASAMVAALTWLST